MKARFLAAVGRFVANLDKIIGVLYKIVLPALVLLALGIVVAIIFFVTKADIHVLNPKGVIAQEQFSLFVFTCLLSLIIIIPVFTLTFCIAWRYREGNKKAAYSPNFDGSRRLETIWWVIPLALITALGVIIWKSSHQLDPYKPLAANKQAITVQVIAMEWKWLFIYPDHNIASVNYVQFPEDTPINFEITADAPMNSFWIPQLGGQVYAMAGMQTKLHLMANEAGSYGGSSANISGEGFASMRFTAKATSQSEFDQWVAAGQKSSDELTIAEYNNLAKPSKNNPRTIYALQDDIYAIVMDKYMTPEGAATRKKYDHDTHNKEH